MKKRKSFQNEICGRFKETREQAGLTQAEYATALQINLSTVKQIEVGNRMPTVPLIVVWANKFKRSYEWILEG